MNRTYAHHGLTASLVNTSTPRQSKRTSHIQPVYQSHTALRIFRGLLKLQHKHFQTEPSVVMPSLAYTAQDVCNNFRN